MTVGAKIMERLIKSAMLIASIAFVTIASAQVTYTATDVSGSTWEYNYTITNNTPINPIGEFTIFYTIGLYSDLTLELSPSNWSSIVAQPDPGLPADSFFDAQALDAGLASGKTANGFSVEFTYLGKGTPGSQLFNIVDPSTYATLAVGNTTMVGTTAAPEIDPASAMSGITLFLGSLAVMRGRRSRKI
jgi:hypothetical protein